MRILLIHNYYQWRGGEDSYVDALKIILQKHGHQVRMFVQNSRGVQTIPDKIHAAWGLLDGRRTDARLASIIHTFKPDVAQIQNTYPLLPQVYDICSTNNIPIVQRISNYRFLCPKATLFRGGKICELCVDKSFPCPSVLYGCYHGSRFASAALAGSLFLHRQNIFNAIGAMIFPTDFIRDYYLHRLSLPRHKLHVIPTFTEDIVSKRSTLNRKYFLYVGRLSEEKGVIPLLEVFRSLPHLQLVLLGDGPLRKYIHRYSQYGNISVVGAVSKRSVAGYMKKAHMTIIPSKSYDVLPHTLIESYRTGTAVMAPATGSFPGLINDGVTGILYKIDRPDKLKSCILYASEHDQEVQRMGANARKTYVRLYTPERHYNMLMKVYKQISIERH